MKKVFMIFMISLVIACGVLGFVFKDKLITAINGKSGGKEVIPVTLNMEDNSTIRPFLEVQKKVLGKKEYKRFLENLNQEVTLSLKEISNTVDGFDNVDNVLYIDDENGKRLDYINMNLYSDCYKDSYTAFNWTDSINPTNPKWRGYFLANEGVYDEIYNDRDVKSNNDKVVKETTIVKDVSDLDLESVKLFYNKDVLTEQELNDKIKGLFGDNAEKVINFISTVKSEVMSTKEISGLFGSDSNMINYGGYCVDDTIYVTASKSTDNAEMVKNNYSILRINQTGDYYTFTKELIYLSNNESEPLSVPVKESIEETTEAGKETAETSTSIESGGDVNVEKSALDILDGLDEESTSN